MPSICHTIGLRLTTRTAHVFSAPSFGIQTACSPITQGSDDAALRRPEQCKAGRERVDAEVGRGGQREQKHSRRQKVHRDRDLLPDHAGRRRARGGRGHDRERVAREEGAGASTAASLSLKPRAATAAGTRKPTAKRARMFRPYTVPSSPYIAWRAAGGACRALTTIRCKKPIVHL
jgi:hypothetical protein